MNRTPLLLSGLALVVLIGGGNVALAQSDPEHVVQASDGTLFLLKDGSRYVIVADAISDDDVAAYADGGQISGSELLSALTLGTPPAAAAGSAATETASAAGATDVGTAADSAPPVTADQQTTPPPATADQPSAAGPAQ